MRPFLLGNLNLHCLIWQQMVVATLLGAAISSVGCNRAYYRQQADADAYALVQENSGVPHWPLEGYTIEIDPRSRMYDPFDRDRPPMPPDDPVSHRYMHRVDRHKGYPRWHANGDTLEVENPDWIGYLDVDEVGQLVLGADDSVRLALLHSPNYQQELEELFLSALDVSFERFRLDSQFFGGYETEYTADGRIRSWELPEQIWLSAWRTHWSGSSQEPIPTMPEPYWIFH